VEDLTPDPILRLSSLAMVRDAVLANASAPQLPRSMVADDLPAGRLSS
jgi:DNA-binding transcriptional LysR family regulator